MAFFLLRPVCFLIFFFVKINSGYFKNDYYKLITDIAERFSLRFIVMVFSDNINMSYDNIHRFRKFTKNFYFSVWEVEKFLFIKTIDEHQTLIVFNWDLEENYLQRDFKIVEEHYRSTWLVLSPKFKKFNYIPFNALFIVADEVNNKTFLSEIYKFSANSTIYSQNLGTWSVNDGLNITTSSFFDRRSNFFREPVLLKPTKKDKSGAANSHIPDFIPGIWKSIEQRLNATSVTHMDSASCDIDANFRLPHGIQFLPVMKEVSSVLFFKEVTSKYSFTKYFDSFSFGIWSSMILWIGVSALAMYTINKFTFLLRENLIFFLLDAFYIFLQQGSQIAENTFHFLSIQTVQLALSLLLFICYGSVLMSFITVSISKPPFKTLDGILENGRYNILTLPGKGYDAFKRGPGVVQKLFVKHVPPQKKLPENFVGAFKRVCSGEKVLAECALQYGPIVAQTIPNPCRVNYVPFVTLKQGYQTTERSPFKEMFKVCITKLLESGAVGKIYWSKSIMVKDPLKDDEITSISIVEVSSVLIIFLAVALIALIIFIWETTIFKRRMMKKIW